MSKEKDPWSIPQTRKSPITLAKQVQDVLAEPFFQPLPDGEIPIPYIWSDNGQSNVVLVLGGNAAGKSFFRRRLASYLARQNHETKVDRFIHLSMGARTGAEGDQRGFSRMVQYGSEREQSTGTLSVRSLTSQLAEVLNKPKGIANYKWQNSRTALFWDEPDVGLSKAATMGMGEMLKKWIFERPPHIRMVFVATHSPEIVRALWPLRPHYLLLGDLRGPPDIRSWLDSQEKPTRIMPDAVIRQAVLRRDLLNRAFVIWNAQGQPEAQRDIEEIYLDWMGIQRETADTPYGVPGDSACSNAANLDP